VPVSSPVKLKINSNERSLSEKAIKLKVCLVASFVYDKLGCYPIMTLRINEGLPLIIENQIVALNFDEALGQASKINKIPWIKQEQTQWCWAASMQMIFRQNDDITTKQCDLANVAFELTGCCSSPSSSLCNKPLPILNIAPTWVRYSFNPIYINGLIEFTTLQTEIDNQRAVEIGFKWNGGGGHAVLAVGWDMIDSVPQVIIHDPWRGELMIPYDKVKTAYGEGQWRWTWINIRR
jgi:hypothetical protein